MKAEIETQHIYVLNALKRVNVELDEYTSDLIKKSLNVCYLEGWVDKVKEDREIELKMKYESITKNK
jgi:hypothetical protein